MASARETADAEPLAHTVKGQYFEDRAAPISKNEDQAIVRIGLQLIAAQRKQPIDAFAEIDGLVSQKDFQLRQQLNHRLPPRRKLATSELMIEASKPGKVRVSREPSPRSSWRRQAAWVGADEESTGSAVTAGSLKKAG
jgi:hypothetical protein